MKKLIGLVVSFVIGLLVFAVPASAQEGSLSMSSSDVSCEGISIWRDSSYRINGRCDGLVYPYETQYDHYVLWAKLSNGTISRVDDIERGYFDGGVFDGFASLFITAEQTSSPRKPSSKTVVSGSVAAFDFDKSTTTVAPQATPAPTTAPAKTGMTVQQGSTATSTATASNVSGVVGTILKSLLVIVAVIVAITIVASLLFRRRGSVSA